MRQNSSKVMFVSEKRMEPTCEKKKGSVNVKAYSNYGCELCTYEG